MKHLWLLMALTVVLGGCGGGSSSSSPEEIASTTISGAVVKGPVGGATVNVFKMDDGGGAISPPVAGPITTNADGSWSVEIPDSVPRPLLVIATGGSYTDEATGGNIDVGSAELSSFLSEGATSAAVSPLSESVVRAARQYLQDNPTASVNDGIADGVTKVQQVFGTGFDPLTDQPDPTSSSPESVKYAAALGGLSQLAADQSPSTDPLATVLAFAEDASDGTLNGQVGTNPVSIDETTSLPTTIGVADYSNSLNTYIASDSSGSFDSLVSYTIAGSVSSGLGSIAPAEVVVFEGDTAQFTIAPATGYQVGARSGCSGEISGGVFTTDPVLAACGVSFAFDKIPYTVTVEPATGGSASLTSATVLFQDVQVIDFTANEGFDLVSVSGCSGSLGGAQYTTGPVIADCTVTPVYERQQRTVSLALNPTIGGSFDVSGPLTALYGDSVTVTATANSGYNLLGVSGCGTGSLTGNEYTSGAVTADCTITASFAAVPTYTVTAQRSGPGTVSPTSRVVNENATATFDLTPDSGAALGAVSGCGGALDAGSPPSYTTAPVTQACTVTAVFESIYSVTVNPGANGSASPLSVEALAGEQPEISITADEGFEIDAVTGSCGGTLSGSIYTLAAVSADCTVDISFVEQSVSTPAVWDQFNWNEANWQ
ncbi:InlB B-repeat-containing protein [Marinobacter halotolerans]|uniref:InlB B-repeat-containing protein n=1 Tax=Marinobacter halotolerans TaxID=1569211 RepID=UPI0012448788|nr:hypothetical protein [Marinobacter halotolerans]